MRMLVVSLHLTYKPAFEDKIRKKSQNGDSGALNPAQSAPECGTLCDNTGRATVNLPYGFFP